MIFDVFLYSGERDLLDLRIEVLSGISVQHVAVQSTHTFTGKRRLLDLGGYGVDHFVWQKPDGWEDGTSAWKIEAAQRNAMADAVGCAAPGDLILMSDVDEIPSVEWVKAVELALGSIRISGMDPIMCCPMANHYYHLNCRLSNTWPGTVATRRCFIGPETSEWMRRRRVHYISGPESCGWHFSYLGGAERIRRKLLAFSHTEYGKPPFTYLDNIQRCIDGPTDLFGRADVGFPAEIVDLQHDDRYGEEIAHFAKEQPHLVRT